MFDGSNDILKYVWECFCPLVERVGRDRVTQVEWIQDLERWTVTRKPLGGREGAIFPAINVPETCMYEETSQAVQTLRQAEPLKFP